MPSTPVHVSEKVVAAVMGDEVRPAESDVGWLYQRSPLVPEMRQELATTFCMLQVRVATPPDDTRVGCTVKVPEGAGMMQAPPEHMVGAEQTLETPPVQELITLLPEQV